MQTITGAGSTPLPPDTADATSRDGAPTPAPGTAPKGPRRQFAPASPPALVTVEPQTLRWRHLGTVQIRALDGGDLQLEQRFIAALPTATLRLRTLGGAGTPTRAQLDQLLLYAPGPSMALAMIVAPGEPGETLVAVARYAPSELPRTAEFAVVVDDQYHGHGIGTELMRRLHRVAAQAGYRWIIGDTFADNAPMLKLAAHLGYTAGPCPDDGALRRLTRRLRRPAAKTPAPPAPPPA